MLHPYGPVGEIFKELIHVMVKDESLEHNKSSRNINYYCCYYPILCLVPKVDANYLLPFL